MSLWDKHQQIIFKLKLSGSEVYYTQLDDDNFVFTDGVRLYIIPESDIILDLRVCREYENLRDIMDPNIKRTHYEVTGILKEVGGEVYRRLVNPLLDGDEIWAQEKFIKEYKLLRFECEGAGKPIVVFTNEGRIASGIYPFDMERNQRQGVYQYEI